MPYSVIAGTGGYLPEKCLSNHDLARMVDTTDEWIYERTGIRNRHIAAEGELTLDLAQAASLKAIEAAGISAQDIDLVVVATTTPDRVFPSTACLLQHRLGVPNCPAFDVQAVCAGFIYALSVVDKFITSGTSRCVLVVGAETFSRIINWQDRSTCILFGDGAGAVVLQAADRPGIIKTHLSAEGRYADMLHVPAGISSGYDRTCDDAYVKMSGGDVYKVAIKRLTELVDETLSGTDFDRSQIDWLVPHQANVRIIRAVAQKLNMPMEHVVLTIAEHGNTSAASVPLALDIAVRDGRIQRDDLLMLEAFGGGFTWGSALISY